MTVLNPVPPRQPVAMAAGATDARYYDMAPDLQPLGDSVASIVSVTAARADGATPGSGDLAILSDPAPWISVSPASEGPSLAVYWWQTGNLAVATDYIVTVTVTTHAGRTLPYACFQLLSPWVG